MSEIKDDKEIERFHELAEIARKNFGLIKGEIMLKHTIVDNEIEFYYVMIYDINKSEWFNAGFGESITEALDNFTDYISTKVLMK